MQKAQRGAGLLSAGLNSTSASLYTLYWQLLQWALVITITLGIGCPRWVRRAWSLPASKGPSLRAIVAILGLLPFTFRVLTAWRTIVFSRPDSLLITIHSIPIYGHTHLSMLRSSELHQVCAYPVQKGFISDHRTRARTSIPGPFATLHPTQKHSHWCKNWYAPAVRPSSTSRQCSSSVGVYPQTAPQAA